MATQIIVVGLGPGAWEQVTLEARDVLAPAADRLAAHDDAPDRRPPAPAPQSRASTISTSARRSFAEIYRQIAESLVARAQAADADRPLIYWRARPPAGRRGVGAPPAAPWRAQAGVPVRIVAGLSFLEPVCTALELDPLQHGLQILDGTELLEVGDPAPPSRRSG